MEPPDARRPVAEVTVEDHWDNDDLEGRYTLFPGALVVFLPCEAIG